MEKTSLNQTNQTWALVEEGLFEYPIADNQVPALLANRCTNCGKTFFPKRPLCPYCFDKGEMEEIKLDRRGIIYACTVIHRNSPTGIIAPYAYGYVDIPSTRCVSLVYLRAAILHHLPLVRKWNWSWNLSR